MQKKSRSHAIFVWPSFDAILLVKPFHYATRSSPNLSQPETRTLRGCHLELKWQGRFQGSYSIGGYPNVRLPNGRQSNSKERSITERPATLSSLRKFWYQCVMRPELSSNSLQQSRNSPHLQSLAKIWKIHQMIRLTSTLVSLFWFIKIRFS